MPGSEVLFIFDELGYSVQMKTMHMKEYIIIIITVTIIAIDES